MIIVLAGNYQQYMNYLREEELTPRAAVYIDHPDKVAGYLFKAEDIHVIGTFWDRPDAGKLHDHVLRYARG